MLYAGLLCLRYIAPLQVLQVIMTTIHPQNQIPREESQVAIKRLLKVITKRCLLDLWAVDIKVEPEPSSLTTTSAPRRSKKAAAKKTDDVAMKAADETPKSDSRRPDHAPRGGGDQSDDDDAGGRRAYDEDDDDGDDPFRGSFLGPGGSSSGISSTLRALSGMVSGVSSRLRDILTNLRHKDDPSIQLIALQELSEILLVSTEDNLSGHFSPDQFVKELVTLMQPGEFGDENPEMMLLACRCIANLMEALPPSTANVVYGGAVPILCQKLLEIHFIDLAEQALSVSGLVTCSVYV